MNSPPTLQTGLSHSKRDQARAQLRESACPHPSEFQTTSPMKTSSSPVLWLAKLPAQPALPRRPLQQAIQAHPAFSPSPHPQARKTLLPTPLSPTKQPPTPPALAQPPPALQARPLRQPQRRAPLREPPRPACRCSWEPWHNARPRALRLRLHGCPQRAAHRQLPAALSFRQFCVQYARPRGGSLPVSTNRLFRSSVLIVSKLAHSFPRGRRFFCPHPAPLLRSAKPFPRFHAGCSQEKKGSAGEYRRCSEGRIRDEQNQFVSHLVPELRGLRPIHDGLLLLS